MAETLYPLGVSGRREPVDLLLEREHAQVRSPRDPLQPPLSYPTDPWLVPDFLWRKAQAEVFLDDARGLAIRSDAGDLAFNTRLAGSLEVLQPPARRLRSDPRAQIERLQTSHFARVQHTWQQTRKQLDQAVLEIQGMRDPLDGRPDPFEQMIDELSAQGHRERTLRGLLRRRDPGAFLQAQQIVIDRELRTANGLYSVLDWATNGRHMIQAASVEVATFAETEGYTQGDVRRVRERFNREFDEELWPDLPRPLQLVIEEMSPLNIALVVGTGALSVPLKASGSRGARAVGTLIEPFIGPTGFARETAAGAGLRLGYEQTEGAPTPVRVAAGGGLAVLIASPDSIFSITRNAANRSLRNTLRGQDPRAVFAGGADYPPLLPHDLPPGSSGHTRRGVMITERMAAEQFDSPGRALLPTVAERAEDVAGQYGRGVPPAVWREIDRLKDLAEPTALARAADSVPLIGGPVQRLLGNVNIPTWLHQAYMGVGSVRSQLALRMLPSRLQALHRLRQTLGTLDRGVKAELIDPDATVTFLGRQIRAADHPLADTALGVITAPGRYDLSDLDRHVIASFDFRNSMVNQELEELWDVAVGEFGGAARTRPASQRAVAFAPIVRRDRGPSRRLGDLFGHEISVESPITISEVTAGRLSARNPIDETIWDVLADPVRGADLIDARGNPRFVTDIDVLFTALDDAKAGAAGTRFWSEAVGGQIRKSATHNTPVDLGGGITRYFPEDEARLVRTYMDRDPYLGEFGTVLEALRQTRLGGDASLLTIQGGLGWLTDPPGNTWNMIRNFRLRQPLRAFRAQAFADDVAANPESWIRMAQASGITITAGTPEELASGYLRMFKIPGTDLSASTLNEATFTALLRAMHHQFSEQSALLVRQGVPQNIADDAAWGVVSKAYPLASPRRLGITPRQAQIERLPFASISFIRQPAAFVASAARGYVKMGLRGGLTPEDFMSLTGATLPRGIPRFSRSKLTARQLAMGLTPEEALSVQGFSQLAGSLIALAGTSAILTAEQRGLTPEEAARRALTPGSSDFLRVWLGPEVSIGVGGPYRAMIQNLVPTKDDPIPNVGRWLDGRLAPPIRLGLDMAEWVERGSVRDFFGEEVTAEDGWLGVAQTLAYFAEQAVPISVGSLVESVRRGHDLSEGIQNVVGEFFGQNVQPPSEYERMERVRRTSALRLLREQELEGLTPAQQRAVEGVRTLTELRKAIGTRAANAWVEARSDEFGETAEQYNAELERRAERGDETAQALLIGVATQTALAALADDVTVREDGLAVVDRPSYRLRRSRVIQDSQTQLRFYEDALADLQASNAPVDLHTAQWYELWDRATVKVVKDGREIDLGVDYDLFDELESGYWESVPQELRALVEANIQAAPRGANPLEIELRDTRRALELAEFWETGDRAYELWWQRVRELNPSPATDEQRRFLAIGNGATDIAEFREAAVPFLVGLIVNGTIERLFPGISSEPDPAQALIRVKEQLLPSLLNRGGSYQDYLTGQHNLWALEHLDDGLAERAVEWGYLSPGVFDNARIEQQRREQSARPDVDGAGEDDIVQRFLDGESYTQLAEAFDISRGAVEQRLRRHFGGSPRAAREQQST